MNYAEEGVQYHLNIRKGDVRVACPILAPRFISAFLLLFASAFSAYATAAALFSQQIGRASCRERV